MGSRCGILPEGFLGEVGVGCLEANPSGRGWSRCSGDSTGLRVTHTCHPVLWPSHLLPLGLTFIWETVLRTLPWVSVKSLYKPSGLVTFLLLEKVRRTCHLKRQGLTWLMVLGGSLHGWLTLG